MSELRFIISSFDNLTSRQLEAVFNLRQRVFIIEQQCLYEDIDGFDNDASLIGRFIDKKIRLSNSQYLKYVAQ